MLEFAAAGEFHKQNLDNAPNILENDLGNPKETYKPFKSMKFVNMYKNRWNQNEEPWEPWRALRKAKETFRTLRNLNKPKETLRNPKES